MLGSIGMRAALAVTIAVASLLAVSASTKHTVEPSTYAYATESELVVMRGTEEVARESIIMNLDYRGIAWTIDGRYAAILTDEKPGAKLWSEGRALVVIDALSGDRRRLPCPRCTGLAAVNDSVIIASQVTQPFDRNGFGALRFDLSDTKPPVELAPDVRADLKGEGNNEIKEAQILSGMRGGALVGAFGEGCRDQFILMRPDGTSERIGMQHVSSYANNAVGCSYSNGPVVTGLGNDAVGNIAVSLRVQGLQNYCAIRDQVLLMNFDGNGMVATDLSPLYPPGHTPGADAQAGVADLWQDAGRLHAVMWAGVCDGTDSMTVPYTEWQLVDNRWEQVSAENIVSKRQLNGDAHLVVTRTANNDESGSLFIDYPASRQKIADGVRAIEVPSHMVDTSTPDQPLQVKMPDICPATCLGVREADIDGDGKPDKIGLVYDPQGKVGTFELNMIASTGANISHVIDSRSYPRSGWLGTGDINGDGQDDIVVNLGAIVAFEYRHGKLLPIRSDVPGYLQLSATAGTREYNRVEYGGFICDNARLTEFRVTQWDEQPNEFVGSESVLEADSDGVFHQLEKRDVNYPADLSSGQPKPPKEVLDRVGAHCTGLDRFPNNQ